uniref:Uncharacterized protein n=1 Tax=Anguilla anguilla TaxID=7936 RepID=A0A0E9PRF0_ANGAN
MGILFIVFIDFSLLFLCSHSTSCIVMALVYMHGSLSGIIGTQGL